MEISILSLIWDYYFGKVFGIYLGLDMFKYLDLYVYGLESIIMLSFGGVLGLWNFVESCES